MRTRFSRSVIALAAVCTSVLAACGGSGGASSAAPAASGAAAEGVAAAKAYLQPFLAGPTSIGITKPLSRKPDGGKLIVGLDSGNDSAKVLAANWEKAAAVLGWTYKDIISGNTPEEQQKAMDAALQLNPAGIAVSGIPVTTIAAQLKVAQDKGIWVNTSASTDAPTGAFFDTSIADPNQLHEWGRMIAAQVVVDSQGKGKVLMFDLPVFPILLEFDTAFKAAIKEWCPGCSVVEHPQQGSDIGTKTPGAVVSALQKNPDATWLVFDLGDLETGVDAALASAGLGSKVRIGGLTGTRANIQAVKNGKQHAWTAYPLPIVGYRQIDSFARKFNGEPTLSQNLPTQLITPENVGSLVVDGPGNYIGVADYETQFKKLWLLS